MPYEYPDQIEKIKYYREAIIKELIKFGQVPDIRKADAIIEQVNTKLSIFRAKTVKAGDTFSADDFNLAMKDILEDLKILYKVVDDISNKKYEELKAFTETHLLELQTVADKYDDKTRFEIGSTALGKTLFYQADSFDVIIKNDTAVISLGNMAFNAGSKIACLFNSDIIDTKNVIFSFDGAICSPYTINKDYFKVIGNSAVNKYIYSIDKNTLIEYDYILKPRGLTPDPTNVYWIYAGEKYIDTSMSYLPKTQGSPILLEHASKISFYVKDATYINFNFSDTPLSRNFDGDSISKPERIQEIYIEVGNNFLFDVDTDGIIYAVKRKGYVSGGELYFPGINNMNNYYIEEYTSDNKVYFNDVTVTINDIRQDIPFSVKSIALKELPTRNE